MADGISPAATAAHVDVPRGAFATPDERAVVPVAPGGLLIVPDDAASSVADTGAGADESQTDLEDSDDTVGAEVAAMDAVAVAPPPLTRVIPPDDRPLSAGPPAADEDMRQQLAILREKVGASS